MVNARKAKEENQAKKKKAAKVSPTGVAIKKNSNTGAGKKNQIS
jgi:hypothetical protein